MTAKFIILKQITDEVEARREPDHEGEDDGFQPATAVQSASATSTMGRGGEFISWKKMGLAIDSIRNFYPRAGGREGTRVLLKSGVKYIVLNEVDEIIQALGSDDVVDLTQTDAS